MSFRKVSYETRKRRNAVMIVLPPKIYHVKNKKWKKKNDSVGIIHENHHYYNIKDTLGFYGYKLINKISTTLQGSLYTGLQFKTNNIIAIKRCNKSLYNRGVAVVNNKTVPVYEDILKERDLMIKLQSNNPPSGFINLIDFIQDNKNYFMIMKFGGYSYWNWVAKSHTALRRGKILIKNWQIHCKILFKQMIIFLKWLHNKMLCCHLDISLENLLIKDTIVYNGVFIEHGCIQFCDWGISQFFNNKTYHCTQYAGKTMYKSPQVFNKIPFNASKADIWSIGVVLFLMLVGSPPFLKPTIKDPYYHNIINGYMHRMLIDNDKDKYITSNVLDLFDHIFCDENKRYSAQDILNHPYLKK